MEALKQAKKSIPDGRWWIKADGCDVRKGFRGVCVVFGLEMKISEMGLCKRCVMSTKQVALLLRALIPQEGRE